MTAEYFVYIIQCRGNRLYTGITTDIERRFSEHSDSKKGARFTRANPPEKILAVWKCNDRSSASKLEYAVKKLRRDKKLLLISDCSAYDVLFGDDFVAAERLENTP